jgi:hypothetical protein
LRCRELRSLATAFGRVEESLLFWFPALKRRAIVISPYGAERFGLLRADGFTACGVAARRSKSGSAIAV